MKANWSHCLSPDKDQMDEGLHLVSGTVMEWLMGQGFLEGCRMLWALSLGCAKVGAGSWVMKGARLPVCWVSHSQVHTASGLDAGLMANPLKTLPSV